MPVQAPSSSKLLLLVLLVTYICLSHQQESSVTISGTTYSPSSCAARCRGQAVDVSTLSLDPDSASNPAGKWSFVMLSAIKNNLATLPPPVVARHLGVFSVAMYDAAAVYSSRIAPYLVTDAPGNFVDASTAQLAAVAGAASKFITTLFPSDTATAVKVNQLLATPLFADARSAEAEAFAHGEEIAKTVFSDRLSDGFQDGASKTPLPSTYNPAQTTPVVTDCSALSKGVGIWQPLKTPTTAAAFVPGPGAVIPESGYVPITTKTQPYAGAAAAFSKPFAGSNRLASISSSLKGPPQGGTRAFAAAMREVLTETTELDDVKKVIAEFWANGPDGTTPPGQWFRIANDEVQEVYPGNLEKAVLLLLGVGIAVHDAGIAAWTAKVNTLGARPITGIQCTFAGEQQSAWLGPYMGVGLRNLSTWQPYQAIDFVTPPFSGYVSGHATFSAAASQVLRLSFRADNRFKENDEDDKFKRSDKTCYKVPEGFSAIEGKITSGPRHVPGFTDVPNQGPGTVGYVPATDVVLCFNTYSAMAKQAADSRIFGGIHIAPDNDDGLKLGSAIGHAVWDQISGLRRPGGSTLP